MSIVELYQDREKDFYGLINEYNHRDMIREDFFNAVEAVAEYKLAKTSITELSMITYKRVILEMIRQRYEKDTEIGDFSDEELLENRVKSIPELKDMKITKFLSNKIKSVSQYASTQELDFFHKLPTDNNEYFVSGDPLDILNAYKEVSTCVSPGGDNIANIFQFLAAPMIHIAFDKNIDTRMLVFIDEKNKVFATNLVYGKFNLMLEISVIKHFIDKGYNYSLHNTDYFSGAGLCYSESNRAFPEKVVTLLRGSMQPKLEYFDRTNLFQRPEGFDYKGDVITGSSYTSDLTHDDEIRSGSGMLMYDHEAYCGSCGYITDSDEYDYDMDMCYSCRSDEPHEYCNDCCEYRYEHEMDYDNGICNFCQERLDEQAEYEADLAREEQYIKELEGVSNGTE